MLRAQRSGRASPWTLKTQGLALAIVTLTLGCTSPKLEEQKQNVLRVAHADDVKTLDPAQAYDSLSLEVSTAILEPLYQFDYLAEPPKIIPLLAADEPQVSADQLTVTIPIRSGIFFADDPAFKATEGKGREVTAADFVFAFKRLADPALQSQGFWIFDGRVQGFNAYAESLAQASGPEHAVKAALPIEGIRALNSTTLQLKLTRPTPRLLSLLTLGFTAPVAQEIVRTYGDSRGAVENHPVGTGPFRLKKWARGQEIVLERNPKYRNDFFPTQASADLRKQGLLADAGKPLPFLDQVQIQIEKEQKPRWKAFEKKHFDLLQVPKEVLATLLDAKDLPTSRAIGEEWKVGRKTPASLLYLAFNMRDPILGKNKALRQALSSAIDREAWIRAFTTGRAQKMALSVPEGVMDRPKASATPRYDFDPERARKLLVRAGFPRGEGLPALTLDIRGNDTEARGLGEMFQQQFAAIGVATQVIYNTLPAFLEKAQQGKLQVSLGGWTLDYPDVENLYQLLYGPHAAPGPNETGYNSPEFNALYEKLVALPTGPSRAAIAGKLEGLLQEDCPWALGIHTAEYEIAQPWLQNLRSISAIPSRFKYLRIDTALKQKKLVSH